MNRLRNMSRKQQIGFAVPVLLICGYVAVSSGGPDTTTAAPGSCLPVSPGVVSELNSGMGLSELEDVVAVELRRIEPDNSILSRVRAELIYVAMKLLPARPVDGVLGNLLEGVSQDLMYAGEQSYGLRGNGLLTVYGRKPGPLYVIGGHLTGEHVDKTAVWYSATEPSADHLGETCYRIHYEEVMEIIERCMNR